MQVPRPTLPIQHGSQLTTYTLHSRHVGGSMKAY